MTVRVAVALGSNLGDRLGHLRRAVGRLAELGEVEAVSSLYESDPVGGPEQGRYLNAVVVLRTSVPPLDLLEALQQIEGEAGRERKVRWGPRTLDLDVIAYGGEQVDLPTLQVPHPRAAERRFVLEPLVEVWPEAPVGGGSAAVEALSEVGGQRVLRLSGEWLADTPTLGAVSRVWVGAQLVLFALWAVAVVWFRQEPDGWHLVVGGALTVVGAALAGWAVPSLGVELTPYPEPRQGARLVERGPYRLVRHPIYGGIVLAFAGLAIAAGAWPALGVVAVLAGFFVAKSRIEERVLTIGVPGYAEYRDRVRHRLIPGDGWIS